MWLSYAIIGYTLLGVVAIFDKYIVSTEKTKPVVFAFYSSIVGLPVLLLIPFFSTQNPSATTSLLLGMFAGVSFVVALYTMYRGFAQSEVSHVGPLVGAATSFFILFLNRYFLAEVIAQRQLAAITMLVIGSLIISWENSVQHRGWHRGMLWGVLSGFCFAIFHVIGKTIYNVTDFFTGFTHIWGGMGFAALFLLFIPAVRMSLRTKKKSGPKIYAPMGMMAIDKVLACGGVFLIQYAVSQGSVTIVNALTGLQYAVLVIVVMVLSHFFPQRFKEEYTRREVAQELVAVGCIALGLGLLLT